MKPTPLDIDQASGDTTEHKPSFITNFNSFIANKTALMLSSMWLFWIIILVFVIAYRIQPPKGAYEIVMYFISAFFQAIALPVLAFVSNIQGDRQERVMNEMRDELLEELRIVKELAKAENVDIDEGSS